MSGYSLIYADCPWRFEVFDRETGLGKSPDRHYRTMTVEELCSLPVDAMAAKDAFLAMWVYDPLLPALHGGEGLGLPEVHHPAVPLVQTSDGQLRLFDPTPRRVLDRLPHPGGACEECWLFKRGHGLPVRVHHIRKEFFAPIREHSRKPDEVAAGWSTSTATCRASRCSPARPGRDGMRGATRSGSSRPGGAHVPTPLPFVPGIEDRPPRRPRVRG